MSNRVSLLIFLGLISLAGYSQQQVYVAPSDNDSGNGTPESPYNKIQIAVDSASPGDTINIAPGTYYENVVVSKSNITIQGAGGDANGNPLSIVDGSRPITGWVKEPELRGTYYHEQGEEPWTLVQQREDGDTYDIAKQANNSFNTNSSLTNVHSSEEYNFEKIFNFRADHMSRTIYLGPNDTGIPVAYWDGIGALYAYRDGKVYLRFREEDNNPNQTVIRYATQPVFRVQNQSYVTIKGLKIRAGVSGVEINGAEAHHNKVADCYIINGQQRVLIVNGARDNEIANNIMRMQGVAQRTGGAWAGGEGKDKEYEYAVNEHIYDVYKFEVGESTSSPNEDCGIDMVGEGINQSYDPAGNNNQIYGNDIAESLSAVLLQGKPTNETNNTKIYRNTIHGMSSMAILVREGTFNTEVYDNLFSDVNFLARIQELQKNEARRVYFYRNRLWNDPGVGSHAFYAYYDDKENPQPNPDNEVYIYHNSLSGGISNLAASDPINLEKWYLINNIFANSGPRPGSVTEVGWYDYNWCQHDPVDDTWYRNDTNGNSEEHNVYPSRDDALWTSASKDGFQLAARSPAIDAGIDITTVKDANGDPLPGFEKGYFRGAAPDLGAIQQDDLPSIPSEPSDSALAYRMINDLATASSLREGYWTNVPAYSFPPGSSNQVEFKAVWNEAYLVIGAEVTDNTSLTQSAQPDKLWLNDALDLLLDPSSTRSSSWDTLQGHRQVIVDVKGGKYQDPQRGFEVVSTSVSLSENVHYYEIRLPWSILGIQSTQLGDGFTLGFDIGNHDRDSEKEELRSTTFTGRTDFKAPDEFAKLVLSSMDNTAGVVQRSSTGLPSSLAARQLIVYPNPSPNGTTRLKLTGFDESAIIRVANATGQVVYQEASRAASQLLPRFHRGLYVVQVNDTQGALTEKLLVE